MTSLTDDLKLYLGVLKRVTTIMTVGLLSPHSRERLLAIYNLEQAKNGLPETPQDPYIIPKTDVFEILHLGNAEYEGVYECGFGHTTEFELKVISNLVKERNPQRIFELGTFLGRTTLNMALNSSHDTQIITLDLPANQVDSTEMEIELGEIRYVKKEVSGERFLGHPAQSKITQLYGDSATFDFSDLEHSIDFAFIDGSHAYDYVLNDSQKVLSLMRPGGLILWHDYTNWAGVRSALNLLYESDPNFKNIKHIGGTSIAMLEV
ncbi:methyltransferase family protein [Dyadobacter jejuensis]|uniref:Methyltransferase family protein n=1 Tax=Dyadobacter jejuensis TaxID=1082580 RepID=A0A316AML7_9BACT|nr:class I SAM-dependent methyltransferase [Dyadobacter jejuensis]PWJ58688.1 methyltransferase family protein [Dyadobacter jejuensis]